MQTREKDNVYGLEEREGEVAIWLAAVTDLYIRARRQTRLFISSDRANHVCHLQGSKTPSTSTHNDTPSLYQYLRQDDWLKETILIRLIY